MAIYILACQLAFQLSFTPSPLSLYRAHDCCPGELVLRLGGLNALFVAHGHGHSRYASRGMNATGLLPRREGNVMDTISMAVYVLWLPYQQAWLFCDAECRVITLEIWVQDWAGWLQSLLTLRYIKVLNMHHKVIFQTPHLTLKICFFLFNSYLKRSSKYLFTYGSHTAYSYQLYSSVRYPLIMWLLLQRTWFDAMCAG